MNNAEATAVHDVAAAEKKITAHILMRLDGAGFTVATDSILVDGTPTGIQAANRKARGR